MTNPMLEPKCICPAVECGATGQVFRALRKACRGVYVKCVLVAWLLAACLMFAMAAGTALRAQEVDRRARVELRNGAENPAQTGAESRLAHLPPRVGEAERFLRQRGWTAGARIPARAG